MAGDIESSLQIGNITRYIWLLCYEHTFLSAKHWPRCMFWSFSQSWFSSNSGGGTLTMITGSLDFGIETDGKWVGGTSVYYFGRYFSLVSIDKVHERIRSWLSLSDEICQLIDKLLHEAMLQSILSTDVTEKRPFCKLLGRTTPSLSFTYITVLPITTESCMKRSWKMDIPSFTNHTQITGF